MAIQKYRKQLVQPSDPPHDAINRVQESIKATTDGILANPVVQGHIIKNVSLKAGVETQVNHNLDRMPQGMHVSFPSTATNPSVNRSKSTSKSVFLTSPVDVTTDLFFF